ncbi:uncharacterized protein [Tiliqua scincoides]|uniref:uncharacterized protein n=1 Tax=Tiliqua scincoides TaxID=71010 RepID=UPI00346377E3
MEMEKWAQEHTSDLGSLSQNHHRSKLSTKDTETDHVPACRITRRGPDDDFSVCQWRSRGVSEASGGELGKVELRWGGHTEAPCALAQQDQCDLGGTSDPPVAEVPLEQSQSPEGRDGTALSLQAGWGGTAEQREGLCLPSRTPACASCSPLLTDRSVDVVECIVKELQGISRIQAEIAELQQHLTLIKGSVDEVSSCVDSVLSEIEGLQSGGGPASRAAAVPKAREPFLEACATETVLYLYGLPEQEEENTKELVYRLLSEYHCFNGIQCSKYIRDAYRSGRAPGKQFAPRPAVVKLADVEQRDFILQKSILLQSAGVTIVASDEQSCPNGKGGLRAQLGSSSLLPAGRSENHGRSVAPRGEAVRTDGDGQFQVDTCQLQRESTSCEVRCVAERLHSQQKSTLARKSSLIAELEEKVGRVVQMIGSSEQTLLQRGCPTGVLAASPQLPRQCAEASWPTGWVPVADSQATPKTSSSLLEGDKAGVPTPGGSESDCDAATLECLSPEPGSLLEETPRGVLVPGPGCDDAVCKLTGSSETLKDMVQIDLNEQDPTEQVFRNVLENSQYFLEHSRDSLDLVDMRFYTNKLGKALSHFRSALQVVFHKLETTDPEVLLEGEKSLPLGSESAPVLCRSSTQGSLDQAASGPPSLSSESQANTTMSSESVGPAQQALPSIAGPEREAPAPELEPLSDPEGPVGQAFLNGEAQQELDDAGWRPRSLEKVCAETIYLNKCINNFKNVLREKRQQRRRLLKEASWVASTEDVHSGTRLSALNCAEDGGPGVALPVLAKPLFYLLMSWNQCPRKSFGLSMQISTSFLGCSFLAS